MKMLLLLCVLFPAAFACEFLLPHQLLVLNDEAFPTQEFQSLECSENEKKDLADFIRQINGRVPAYQIKEFMAAKGHAIEVHPASIQIHHLKSLLQQQLALPAGVQIKATRNLGSPGIITLDAGDRVEVSCSSCLFGAQQTVSVAINSFSGERRIVSAQADFKKVVKAYRLLAPLASFSQLSDLSIFKEETVESIPYTDLVTDLSLLKFYKTNKPLRAGDIVRLSDLNAVNLVKAGLKTEVVLENSAIRIKTHGISRSNGVIGEFVEVFHPQKNKKYQGRVVDINKVLVEL